MSKQLSLAVIERAENKQKSQQNSIGDAMIGKKYLSLPVDMFCAWIDSAYSSSTLLQIKGFAFACDYFANGVGKGKGEVLESALCLLLNNPRSLNSARQMLVECGVVTTDKGVTVAPYSIEWVNALSKHIAAQGFTSWQGGYTPAKAGSERYGVTVAERREQLRLVMKRSK